MCICICIVFCAHTYMYVYITYTWLRVLHLCTRACICVYMCAIYTYMIYMCTYNIYIHIIYPHLWTSFTKQTCYCFAWVMAKRLGSISHTSPTPRSQHYALHSSGGLEWRWEKGKERDGMTGGDGGFFIFMLYIYWCYVYIYTWNGHWEATC